MLAAAAGITAAACARCLMSKKEACKTGIFRHGGASHFYTFNAWVYKEQGRMRDVWKTGAEVAGFSFLYFSIPRLAKNLVGTLFLSVLLKAKNNA